MLCVFMWLRQSMPPGIHSSFYWLWRKRKRRWRIYFQQNSQTLHLRKEKKMVTCKHLEKLFKHIYGFSTESLPIWWMPRENGNAFTIPKNRKGLYISTHSTWRQEMAVWTEFRDLSPLICMLGTGCLESLCLMTLNQSFSLIMHIVK